MANFTQVLYVNMVDPTIRVQDIVNIPDGISTDNGEYVFSGIVEPIDATHQNIIYTLISSTDDDIQMDGATISGLEEHATIVIGCTIKEGLGINGDYYEENTINLVQTINAVTELSLNTTKYGYYNKGSLLYTIKPADATNQRASWYISDNDKGHTGATLTQLGEITEVENIGTLTVKAIIENGSAYNYNYEREFDLTVFDDTVAVTNIECLDQTLVAKSCIEVQQIQTCVYPENATWQNIEFTIISDGGTEATIDTNTGEITNIINTGTVIIETRVVQGVNLTTDYVQEHAIEFTHVPISVIPGEPISTCMVNVDYTLDDLPFTKSDGATNTDHVWSVKSTTLNGITIEDGILKTTHSDTESGEVTVTMTIPYGVTPSVDYELDFTIPVHATFISVDYIDVHTEFVNYGESNTLSCTVYPENATVQDVTWVITNKSGNTSAVVNGNVLSGLTAAGTIVLSPTVVDGMTNYHTPSNVIPTSINVG